MSSMTFFLLFIPILGSILLIVNFILAPHKPDKNKDSQFECGFSSFTQMSRLPFSISFFIYALLFLLFDLEILLVYPYVVSSYNNSIYGLIVMLVFFILLTIGFVFELGKKALYIESRQSYNLPLPSLHPPKKTNIHNNSIKKRLIAIWHSVIYNLKSQLKRLWEILRQEMISIISIIKERGYLWFTLILVLILLSVLSVLFNPVIRCDSDSEETAKWKNLEVHVVSRSNNNQSQNESGQASEESQSDNKDKNLENERSTWFDSAERSKRIEYEPAEERSTFWDSGIRADRIEYDPHWRNPDNWEAEYLEDKARKEAYAKLFDDLENVNPETEQGEGNIDSVNKDIATDTPSEKALGKRKATEDIPSWVSNIPKVEEQDNTTNTLSEKALGKRKLVEFDLEPVSNKKPDLEDLRSKEQFEEDTQKAIWESINLQSKEGESSNNPVDYEDSDYSDNTSVYSSLNGTESPGTYQKKLELLQRDEFIKEEQRNIHSDENNSDKDN